jgi:CubicO group peptidase (beta-lactamase class C family)
VVTDAMRPRLLHRPAGIPFGPDQQASFEGPYWEATQHGAAGVYTSALDALAFGQMILDGGKYGSARILSRPTVDKMTSDRIPGTPALIGTLRQPDSGYGYGWLVRNHLAWRYFGGGLVPAGSISHVGAGGTGFWIDRDHALVGFCAEFVTEVSADDEPLSWVENRFEDVIVSAIAD